MGFGGYFKGEKKKSKKDKEAKNLSNREAMVLPEILAKKKKDW